MPGLGRVGCYGGGGGDDDDEEQGVLQQSPSSPLLHDIEDLVLLQQQQRQRNNNNIRKRRSSIHQSITNGKVEEEDANHHHHHHNNNNNNGCSSTSTSANCNDDDDNVAVVVVKRPNHNGNGGGNISGSSEEGKTGYHGDDDDVVDARGGIVVRMRRRKKLKEGGGGGCGSEDEVKKRKKGEVTEDRCRGNNNNGDIIMSSSSNDLNPASHTVYLKTWGCSHNNSDSEYMAGLLGEGGFRVTTTDYNSASIVILNSCTVKGPSEQHFRNEIEKARNMKKHLVLAGCVPQSDKSYRKVASVIGVQQIERVVEVVEETLKGNKVSFLSRRRVRGMRRGGGGGSSSSSHGDGADLLALPKIRKNELIEIVPVSSGCLNNCTYCKTKLARGQLASYSIDSIVNRIDHVIRNENIKEIWLTSEDLGAWGIDLGLTIVDLLNAVVMVLESFSSGNIDDHVMLRLGMTNPPYIMDHLEEISKILSHPNVYEFLHIPVQSGSDSVLLEMKREYGRKEFEEICDFMIERHPSITIATDIICGYPTETEEDFESTFSLVSSYQFPVLFINQFYPRPGTPAAKLKRIPTEVVKSRTRRLNELFQGYMLEKSLERGEELVGSVQRVLVTEVAHDRVKLVGHNKGYQQVLVDRGTDSHHHGDDRMSMMMMGKWLDVEIVEVGKFSMIGGGGGGGGGAVVVVGGGGSSSIRGGMMMNKNKKRTEEESAVAAAGLNIYNIMILILISIMYHLLSATAT